MARPQMMSGFFLVSFLVCAGAIAGDGIFRARGEMETAQAAKVINGQWAAAYERVFNRKVGIYQPSIDISGILNYVFFKEGREGVLVGEDGWLFTKEEFDFVPDQAEQVGRNLGFISDVRDRLARQHIDLVVALLPAKARLYSAHLGRYRFPAYRKKIYSESLATLRGRGVEVADIGTAFLRHPDRESLFLRTDTHWSPAGAKAAAEVIGQTVAARLPTLAFEKKSFRALPSGVKAHEGDLLRYLPLGPLIDDIGPAPDPLVRMTVASADDKGATDATDLFG
jgi:alginate O-acetyltransferase complex protein AlgJ